MDWLTKQRIKLVLGGAMMIVGLILLVAGITLFIEMLPEPYRTPAQLIFYGTSLILGGNAVLKD